MSDLAGRLQGFISSILDGSLFTPGSTPVTTIAALTDDVATATAAEGTVGAVRKSSRSALCVTLDTALFMEDQAGNRGVFGRRWVATSTDCVTVDKSAALEASSVAKASAGNLIRYKGYIDATAPSGTYYVYLHDGTAAPGAGAAITQIATGEMIAHVQGIANWFDSLEFPGDGLPFATGCVIGISTNASGFLHTSGGAYMNATAMVK